MNFHKYLKKSELIDNPLCGIGSYVDTLNMSNGLITRRIKKMVLTGSEDWRLSSWGGTDTTPFYLSGTGIITTGDYDTRYVMSTHFPMATRNELYNGDESSIGVGTVLSLRISSSIAASVTEFKSWLTTQYNSDNPVIAWFVLAQSQTETIEIGSAYSGTVDGYLLQNETPSPTNPINPIANNAVGWYDIKNYVRNTTWQQGSVYTYSGGSWSAAATKKRRRRKK